MDETPSFALLNEIVDRVSVGILVVNKDYELVLWNNYMENYSQKKAEDIIGENIFTTFPDLPKSWLEQKIRNVFILKNFSFTSWEHRPYLFKFFHNRPITGGIDYMRQNCTFLPIKGESGDIEYVCITLLDVTDTSIYEGMLKSAVKSLAESSNRDGLTNIYNRRFLEQSMSKEFARIKRYGGTLSFVIIDLDHFKKINDTYGHLAGDEILKIASKRIGECLRESDVLARYGGEEFAVMLPETPLEGADILANRLCKHLAKEPVFYNDTEIHISASLGVAEFQPDLENHEQLISRADSVLYVSKENGRNQVTIFDHNNPDKFSRKQSKDQDDVIESEAVETSVTEIADDQGNSLLQDTASENSTAENKQTELQEANLETTSSSEDMHAGSTLSEAQGTNESDAELESPSANSGDSIEDDINTQTNSDDSPALATHSEDLSAAEIDVAPAPQEEVNEEHTVAEPDLETQQSKTENITTETEALDEVTNTNLEADETLVMNEEFKGPETSDIESSQEEHAVENGANETTEKSPNSNEADSEETFERESDADPSIEDVSEISSTEELSDEQFEQENSQTDNEQLDLVELSETIETNENECGETGFANNQKELTAEEKADLAMIAAFGNELKDENSTATVIDMKSTESSNPQAEVKNAKIPQETIYVKLGSK